MYAEFQLVEEWNAPKAGTYPVQYRLFRVGETVTGKVHNPTNIKTLYTKEGYAIPLNVMKQVRSYKPQTNTMPANGTNLNQKIYTESPKSPSGMVDDAISKSPKTIVGEITNRTKTATTYALVGGGIALVYALAKRKSWMMWTLGGIIAGGYIGNIIGNHTEESKPKNNSKNNNKTVSADGNSKRKIRIPRRK